MSQTFLNQIKQGALQNWHKYQILPSITGAQAALESGWGKSKLALAPNYNLFGIKWSSDYPADKKVNMPTLEYGSNGSYMIYADFRTYDSWNNSVSEHGAFFTNTPWRTENYKAVVGETDYKKAAQALKNAPSPYATDPAYATSLIRLIEDYNLQEWDKEALQGTPANAVAPKKTVGGDLSNQAKSAIKSLNITLIGDSLGVGTHPYLVDEFNIYNSDVLGSRQLTHATNSLNGTKVLQNFLANGTLKDIVVVILGTNRGVTDAEIDTFVELATPSRKIIFVDTASQVNHKTSVATAYQKASERHDTVYYANWSAHASAYYYGSDKIHMTSEGYRAHAEFIKMAVYEASARVEIVRANASKTASTEYYGIHDIEYNQDGIISLKGESVIYNDTANQRWGNRFNGQSIYVESILDIDSDDPQVLFDEGLKVLKENADPLVQYTVNLADLPDDISIGDTGIFIDHEFNPPLYIQARVLELITSETDPYGNQAVIGNALELFPTDKTDLLNLQKDLKDTRENLLNEYRKGQPYTMSIESTNGELFVDETRLIARVLKGENDITELITHFVWERDSEYSTADGPFNEMLKQTATISHLTVYEKDLFMKPSLFTARAYLNNEQVAVASVSIKVAQPGKSAYELAVENGFEGNILQWINSLQGADGESGLPGEKGEDGRTRYLHIAYANSQDGQLDFSTTDAEDKRYFGTYTDLNETDSQDYTKYKWMLVRGNDGKTPIKGVDYFDGQDGQDGQSNFVHVMYSANETGTPMTIVPAKYIGIAVSDNHQAPTDYTLYKWQLLQGSNGVPGERGADGRTAYLHIKYSNNNGVSFTANNGETVGSYMGVYTDFTEADSISPAAYTWSRTLGDMGPEGPAGPQGVPGAKGADGLPTYTWIKYADTSIGGGISNLPEGKAYIGFAYNKSSQTESNNTGDYKWALIKGEDGVEGPKGVDGKTTYTWIKYAPSADGTGMTQQPQANTSYIGIGVNKLTSTESDNKLDYTWTLFKGDKGDTGATGDQGPQGVSITKVDVQYYLSTSATALAGGTWSTTAPAWVDGQFMWSKTVTTYTSGSPTESTPVCITGAKGATGSTGSTGGTGATGRGISSIVEQFYLSTSKTTQTGGTWSTTMPTWSVGKYVWTRSLITYTTGTPTTSTTTPLVSSEWEAINELLIGGSNLLLNSRTLNLVGGNAPGITRTINAEGNLEITATAGNGNFSSDFGMNPSRPNIYANVQTGEWVTFSIEARSSNTTSKPTFYFGPGMGYLPLEGVLGTSWSKLYVTNQWVTTEWSPHFGFSGIVGKIEFRKAQLEKGNKATDWSAAIEDTQADIDSKADAQFTSDQINAMNSEIARALQEEQAAAVLQKLGDYQTEQERQKAIDDEEKRKSEQLLKNINAAIPLMSTELADMTQNWNMLNSNIIFGQDAITIQSYDKSASIVVKNNRLSFYSGGTEVAYISDSALQIGQGIFTDSMRVGNQTNYHTWTVLDNGVAVFQSN